MLAYALFAIAGFACGFMLRFAGFAIGVVALVGAYGVLLWWTGSSSRTIAVELLLGLILLQVGCAVAVAARTLLAKLRFRFPGFGRLYAKRHLPRTRDTDHSA